MEKELLIALFAGTVSFLIFLKAIDYLGHIFSVEMPGVFMAILWIGVAIGLFAKREFFFGLSPIVTGVTVGILLSFLWNIKNMGFIEAVLKTVISFRFLIWVMATAVGVYERAIVLNLWNKYVVFKAFEARPYILAVVVIIYIFGSIILLFPELYIKTTKKNAGFSMMDGVSRGRRTSIQFIGVVIVLLSSTLIMEAVMLIYMRLI